MTDSTGRITRRATVRRLAGIGMLSIAGFTADGRAASERARSNRGDRTSVPESASRTRTTESLLAERSRSSTVVGAPVAVRAIGGTGAYEWTVLSAPDGSEIAFHDPHERVTSARPDDPGEYVLGVRSGTETQTVTFDVSERSRVVERYAPRLHFHADTAYRPTRLETLVTHSRLRSDDETVTTTPTVFDLAGRDGTHFLELRGDASAYPTYQDAYPPTVYASVTPSTTFDGTEYTAVAYWFVYTYDPKHGLARFGSHQADVESLVVLLDGDGDGAYVAPAAHGRMTIVPFDQIVTTDAHPHVYPERKSHATYLRDTTEYDGDGYQVYSIWSDADADCDEIDEFESAFHSEWTGSDETWSHDGSVGTEYDLVELVGNEVWATYEGGLSDEPGSITIPHQRDHYRDAGDRIERRGCPDHEQVSGWIERDGDAMADGTVAVDVTVGNDGGKPHPFWVTVESDAGAALASERVPLGTADPSVFGDGRGRTGTVRLEVAPSTDDRRLRVELWLHSPARRRAHDLEDTAEPITLEAE